VSGGFGLSISKYVEVIGYAGELGSVIFVVDRG